MAELNPSSDDTHEQLPLPASHPRPPSGSLDDEVPTLVAEAQADCLDRAMSNFFLVNRRPFLSAFERQVKLIRNRSQAFEDGQVTIYDKVLLALTNNGTDLNPPSAIQYYCNEFLGIDMKGDSQIAYKALDQTLQVQSILKQELFSDSTLSAAATAADQKELPYTDTSGTATAKLEDMEPNLAKIWAVYQEAKQDYDKKADHEDDAVKFKAAKFLRDTAENILIQLKGKNTDEDMLMELNSTFKMAKAMVVSLSGGKKRKFDPVAMDSVKGVPRGPSSEFASQDYTEDTATTGAMPHRGRTRPQRPPPVLRRDERRFDERCSFEEQYPSLHRMRNDARFRSSPRGHDDRYHGGNEVFSLRPDRRTRGERFPESVNSNATLEDVTEEYDRQMARESGGTDYVEAVWSQCDREAPHRGHGDDDAGHGYRHRGRYGGSDDARQYQREKESRQRSVLGADDWFPRGYRGNENTRYHGPSGEQHHHASRGQRQYSGRHDASDETGSGYGYAHRHGEGDHANTHHSDHRSPADETTHRRDDGHVRDEPSPPSWAFGFGQSHFHPGRNVDHYQPGRDY